MTPTETGETVQQREARRAPTVKVHLNLDELDALRHIVMQVLIRRDWITTQRAQLVDDIAAELRQAGS